MTAITRPTAAEIIQQAMQTRGADARGPLGLAPPRVDPAACATADLLPVAGGTGALRRLRNEYRWQQAQAKVDLEVIDGMADVHRLVQHTKVDAAKDRAIYNYLLTKAEHGEQVLVAAQLLDERLLRLQETGCDRLDDRCEARIQELHERAERGLYTPETLSAKVLKTLQDYAELAARQEQFVKATRNNTDAMLSPAAPAKR